MRRITAFTALFLAVFSSQAVEKRTPFDVPLPYLNVIVDEESGAFQEVFITYGENVEGWAITDFDDKFCRASQKERLDHFHREMPQFAYVITDFEAEQINKVCNSFIRTLGVFERDLQRKRWDRLLYLDSYLAPFLGGFYYLVTAARCNRESLPRATRIPRKAYDESLESPKSDRRVGGWRADPEHVTKMRIVTKELVFHMQQWQKKVLRNSAKRKKADRRHRHGNFEKAYELFVRMYFLRPPAKAE